MSSKTISILALALIALTAMALHRSSPTRAANTTRTDDDGDENVAAPSRADDDDEQLRAHVRQLERAMLELQRAKAEPTTASSPAARATPPPTPQEQRAFVDEAFAGEPHDQTWHAETTQLATSLKQVLPEGSSVRSIDCRTTLCRVESSHRDEAHYRTFVEAAFTDPARAVWNGGAAFYPQPSDGSGFESVVYLVRAGEVLPSPAHFDQQDVVP